MQAVNRFGPACVLVVVVLGGAGLSLLAGTGRVRRDGVAALMPLSASAECLFWTTGGAIETGYYSVVESRAPRLWCLFGDRPALKAGDVVIVRRGCDGQAIGYPRTNGKMCRWVDGRTVCGIDY